MPAKPVAPAVIGGRGRNGDVFQRSGARWTISLMKTPFGNAPTSETDAF